MNGHDGPGLGELVVRALRRYPERTALVSGERRLTYARTAELVGRAVAALDRLGLRPGDTVLQAAGNRPEQWCVQMACALVGLRSAGVPPGPGADELAELAAWCGADLVLTDADLDGFLLGAPAAPLVCRAEPGDVVRLAFTRGTTGPRKRVLLSGRALAATALLQLAEAEWPAQVRLLCAEPVSGGFGTMVLPALLRGGTVVLAPDAGPATVVAALAEHRPTVAHLLTANLVRLLGAPATDLSPLHTLVYSGGPLTPPHFAAACERVAGLVQVTGQTEVPKALAVLGRADHVPGLAPTDVGVPFSGMRVAVADPDGAPVADGAAGELCVRGPAVMSGYADDPDRTARAARGGWHHTGDRACLDARGHLHLLGRL